MSALHDPEVEAGAIALAWLHRPAAMLSKLSEQTAEHKRQWWKAQTDIGRDSWRLQASTVLEAVDELRELAHAAE